MSELKVNKVSPVTGTELTLGDSGDTVDLSATTVTLPANSVNSDQYVDGSIDTIHIGNDQVTGAKLNPALVAGDVIYADGTDTINRLAKGTAEQVLAMNAGATAPEWADAAGGGKMLQIITTSVDTSQTITTSEATASGSSLTITPVASGSSFLYVFDSHGYSNGNPGSVYYQIKRDGTMIRKCRVISKQTANDDHERLDINVAIVDVTPTYTLGNTLTYLLTAECDNSTEHSMNPTGYTKGTLSYLIEIGA